MLSILILSIVTYFALFMMGEKNIFTVPSMLLGYYKLGLGALFVLTFNQLHIRSCKAIRKVLAWSDKYSYGIYLCHHMFILGTLSVMSLTSLKSINVVAAVCFAAIAGCSVTKLSSKIIIIRMKANTERF